MLRKLIVIRLAVVALLALFFLAASFAVPETISVQALSQADCSKAKDSSITKKVVNSLKANFSKDERLFLNFNITTNNGVVKLKGGVPGQKIFDRVIKAVKDVPCVKEVDQTDFSPTRQQHCDPPDKPCNGGCIGQNETCTRIG